MTIIKHDRFLDVAFLCGGIKRDGENITVRGQWLNLGFVETWGISKECVSISFKISEVKDWKVCENTDLKCLRYADWKPLTLRG